MPVAILLLLKTLGLTVGAPMATYYLTKLAKTATGGGVKAVLVQTAAAAGTAALLTATGANPLPGGVPGTPAIEAAPAVPASPLPTLPPSPALPFDPTTLAGAGAAAIALAGSSAGFQFWKDRAAGD